MTDSSFDPRTGAPARSNNVRYTLLRQGSSWALRVDLDAAWLADPKRAFPVTVDPTYATWWPEGDDTFVSTRDYAWRNNSNDNELLVGTYDWGGEVSASFLHFDAAMAALHGTHIYAANLVLYNSWSWSCQAAPVSIHAVTQPWQGWTSTSWPGPTYEATPLGTPPSFAYGYTYCPTQGWGYLPIDANRMTAWARGQEPFYGFSLQASWSDAHG
jgi:hypothetical protein